MADGVNADFSELMDLSRDLGDVATNAGRYINSAVQVSSRKIKDDAQKSVRSGDKRWHRAAAAIDYEVKTVFGQLIQSEIGYDKEKALSQKPRKNPGPGTAGNIGNIREFGSVNSTPHNDLRNALEKNQKDFEAGLDKALQDAERVLTGGGSVSSAASAVIRGRY